jgi:biopolymer transport protein ExbD
MARKSVLREEEPTEIDLAPMIDCVFILLIFFIVTTVFVQEQGFQVAKPDAAASPSLEQTQNVTLEITADNKILFAGAEIGLADVGDRVKVAMLDPETPVVIRAQEKSDHGVFVGVWDAARRAGAQVLSFQTVN